jgi:ABC-2 type transport system permease protein
MTATFVRYEILRTFRNWKFVFFSTVWPLILYVVVCQANRQHTFDGVAFPLYFMTGMAAFGTMGSVAGLGARIAAERSIGWTRQLRITPLPARTYLFAKVLCGYLSAALAIALLGAAGIAMGVRLPPGQWLAIPGLLLVGLIPFAVLGILLGHVLGTDSLTAVSGGLITLFALLGGSFGFLVVSSGPVFQVLQALPSYWLVQAGKTVVQDAGGWPPEGWIVIAAWTVVLTPAAIYAYRHDTTR